MGELRRDQRPLQPDRQLAHRPWRAAGRVGQRDDAQLRGVHPGVVRDPQGRGGHELDQHGLQGRLPQLDDQPRRGQEALHLGRVPGPARPDQGRAAHPRARDHPRVGQARGPGPGAAPRAPRGAADRLGRRARRHHLLLDRRRPDHVHLGHHRPLQGRHQAERGRLLLGARPAGGRLRDRGQERRVAGGGHLLLLPAPVPLQRPGALGLPGPRGRRPGRLRGALLVEPLLAAGDRRRGHDLQLDRRRQLLHLEHPGVGPGQVPQGPHLLCRPRSARHLQRVPGALRGQVHRGLRPHRDRHGDLHGPDQAGRAGLDGQGQPGLRGHDRGAGHRPARCPRTPRARSSWT